MVVLVVVVVWWWGEGVEVCLFLGVGVVEVAVLSVGVGCQVIATDL